MSLNSICILRLSAIGDVCHAVAAVQAIQKRHPDARITWIIGKLEQQLLEGLEKVDFIVFDKSKGRLAYKELKQQLAGRSFDVLLHMQLAFRANWAARLVSARRKIGFDRARSKELHSLFIKEAIDPQEKPHVIEGFFAFANKLGVPFEALSDLHWHIPVSSEDERFAEQFFPVNQKTLVIAPAASKAERNWLPERYAAIADHAASCGFVVVLCGGPADLDRELTNQIIENNSQPF